MLLQFQINENDTTIMNTTKRAAPKIGDILDIKYTLEGVIIPKRLANRVRITNIETDAETGCIYIAEKL